MSKYIEIEVPDNFGDSERTPFEAVECATNVCHARPISRGELLKTLRAVSQAGAAHNWRCNCDEPDAWALVRSAIAREAANAPEAATDSTKGAARAAES